MTMRCDSCGGEGARVRRVTRTYGEGADLLVIENVPVVYCSGCGESYMTAETMREIERLRANRRGLAEDRQVGFVRFDAA